MKKLDLGCGSSKKEGYIGVDVLPLKGVDIVHSLIQFPYPFEDNSIDEIWMDNVLEHLPNPVRVVEELHRICKPNAKVTICVPYFRSLYAFIDPTHVNFFSVQWFNYFDPKHEFQQRYQYSKATFNIDKLTFDREAVERNTIGFFKKIILWGATKQPNFYERKISHLYPLNSLTFYLTVLK